MSSEEPGGRVAVIDRDSGFLRVLARRFERSGWKARIHPTPVPPEDLLAMKLDALVLDLRVLDALGWEYLERVSSMLPELAVIVCSLDGTLTERVRALRLGADDWVAKPAHPEEILARIQAITRRRRRNRVAADRGPLVAGEIEIRPDRYQAFIAGESLELTRREFELLEMLVETSPAVAPREQIYHRVWGYEMVHGDRSVDVFVRKLRQKLQQASPGWIYIHTHFGVGYRFEADALESERAASTIGTADSDPADSQPLHSSATTT